MSDLTEYEDTIEMLRSSLSDLRYERPVPELPKRPRISIRTGVVAAAVLIAGSVWLVNQSPDPAWAAAGQIPTADETAALTETCAAQATEIGTATSELPTLVAAEVRGRTASLVYAAEDRFVTCVAQDFQSGSDQGRMTAIAEGEIADLEPANGPVRFSILTISDPPALPGAKEPQSANTWVVGIIEPQVDQVLIETSTLGQFEATVADGWFTAWWPTTESFEIVALDSNGAELARTGIN